MAAETAQLVAIYDMPTATLDTSKIDQVRSDAQARLDDLHLDWLPNLLSDLLTRLRQRLDAGGLPDDPETTPNRQVAQLTAVASMHRVCAGWDNPAGAPNEAANGALDVTAIVDTGKLNPEVWGTATACRARFPPADTGAAVGTVVPTVVNATVDGTLIIYLLAPLPATAAEAQRTGLGRALVLGCVAYARENGARLLWCNARTYAAGFYSKLRFEIVGKEFDIPDVGAHYRMKLELKSRYRAR
jgi:GNAT superfamily N-acetyltransferase